MISFEKSILIDCNISKVFEFHTDTNNLLLITPPGIKVAILKIDTPVKKGSEINLRITQFGIFSNKWNLIIEEFEPDTLICDKQIKGPFKSWVHYHIFEDQNGHTLMTDRINYELPFGFIGILGNKILIRNLIEKQFDFRHSETKKILESKIQK